MKRYCCVILTALLSALLFAGCERRPAVQKGNQNVEHYLSAEEDTDVLIIREVFSEETPYPELAEFLADYYQVPAEELSEVRYYYNYIDLNNDGADELFAFVIGDCVEVDNGNPALILSEEAKGEFTVLESFAGIHTPVLVAENTVNGWRIIQYQEYGGEEDGYRVCKYNPDGGYQTDLTEVVEETEPMAGKMILSNNLIDDLDKERYLTLAPAQKEAEE